MKEGNCLPVSGWMFEQDAIKMKLKFHQVAQERMTRTINAIAALRPECILNTLPSEMRNHIGLCAGRDYQDMTFENAITIKVEVTVERSDCSLVLSGFDSHNNTVHSDHFNSQWVISFLCWNPTVQILKEIMTHAMSLIPNDLFLKRLYCVEYPEGIMEDLRLLNQEDMIAEMLTDLNKFNPKTLVITQWFGSLLE